MRGDRRGFEGQSVGREDAADAGARAIHRPLQAGDRGAGISCAEVRRALAAYRRDDWPTSELSALRRHLERCAGCRRVEADFRGVGEHIRRLPSITPPASMRANVFAAIAAEERRVAPAVLELSRATTDP